MLFRQFYASKSMFPKQSSTRLVYSDFHNAFPFKTQNQTYSFGNIKGS